MCACQFKTVKQMVKRTSEVFGVGKLAFSRYERGKTQPPAPLLKLLKLVERHHQIHFVGHVMVDNLLHQLQQLESGDASRFAEAEMKLVSLFLAIPHRFAK